MEAFDQPSRRAHSRLSQFARFSRSGGLGLCIESAVDELLAEHGFIKPGPRRPGWVITEKGNEALQVRYEQFIEQRRPHEDLVRRVARWLERQGRRAWINRTFSVTTLNDMRAVKHLGLASADGAGHDVRFLGPQRFTARPDVFSIARAERRTEYQPSIFEIKVSRNDFFSDVDNPKKRLAYLLLAERVYYACPAGLVSLDELPPGCGLVVETRKGIFRVLHDPPACKTRHSAHLNELLRPRVAPVPRSAETTASKLKFFRRLLDRMAAERELRRGHTAGHDEPPTES